jgi:hypothetical protein
MVGTASCNYKSKHSGFTLQRFKITNNQLLSIAGSIKDSMNIVNQKEYVIILILRNYNSSPEFCFTFAKAEDVSKDFIYIKNRRIIGYIQNNGIPIIVLSTENSKYDFEMTFYKFIVPTTEVKYFDYIYFPEDQYSIDSRGFGAPPPFFDPHYYYYACKGGKIVSITYGK